MTAPRSAAVAVVLAAGGCAGVNPHDGFPAVAADVRERTGVVVHWHDGSPADREADRRVAGLLAKPLDAPAAVQVTLLNNRRLQATYENLGVAQADLVAAGLLRNPVFNGAYEFGERGLQGRVELGLTLDLVDLLFLGTRRKIAAARLEAVKAETTAAVLDVAGRTRVAFYAHQAAVQTAELRRQIAQATAASEDLAKRLFDAGNTTALALATEQALHVQSELDLDHAEAEVTATRERLAALLGTWGGQSHWTTAGRLEEPQGDEPPAAGLEKRAVAASLDLKAGRARIAESVRSLGVALPLGLLSELEAGVAVEREDGDWYTGPAVTLPVPVFSQGQPAVARAEALVRQGRASLYATAVEVRSAARAAHARVIALRRQVDRMKTTLLPLRQKVVTQSQLQYNAMQIGGFELLTAKRDQITAAAAYLLLLRDYWTARSELDELLAGHLPDGPLAPSPGIPGER